MKKFLETFKLPINITIPKNSPIEKLDSSIYTSQSLVSTCDIICVGNGIFFYFNEYCKLDIYVIVKRRYPVLKISSVLFVGCTEMNWKTSVVNGLCISIFLDNMGLLLGVIVKLHNG